MFAVPTKKRGYVSDLDLDRMSRLLEGYVNDNPLSANECRALIAEARRAAAHRVEIDELRRVHAQCVDRAEKAARDRDELAAALRVLLAPKFDKERT